MAVKPLLHFKVQDSPVRLSIQSRLVAPVILDTSGGSQIAPKKYTEKFILERNQNLFYPRIQSL